MGDLVNLRRERKRKAREKGARQAADRRAAAFGVSKLEKLATKARADLAERTLDAHKLEGKGPRPSDAS